MTDPKRFAQPRWHVAQVDSIRVETPAVKTLDLKVPGFPSFRPGQHVDVRLTAPDGYQAQRSYSISSAPERLAIDNRISITVELMRGGEVSPYLHDEVQAGEEFEVLGLIGMPFSWVCHLDGPLALVAGGSGIAPIMSIILHQQATCPSTAIALLYSVRSYNDLIFRDELESLNIPKVLTLTRESGHHAEFHSRRIDCVMLEELLAQLPTLPKHTYICGGTPFVEAVAGFARECALPATTIHTERFGG